MEEKYVKDALKFFWITFEKKKKKRVSLKGWGGVQTNLSLKICHFYKKKFKKKKKFIRIDLVVFNE